MFIALPVASAMLGNFGELKPYIAFTGLLLLFLDIALLDQFQKRCIKRGAKLQEEFDTKVLKLPWNSFVAGDNVIPEDIRSYSSKPLSEKREREISSWYESCVGEVPIHIGRLICQRTNIHYDQRLRRRYGGGLVALTVIAGFILLFAALRMDPKFSEVIMSFFVPFTPILSWTLREHRKQLDTAAALERLQSEFKKMWAAALGDESPQMIEIYSRQLQDAIYQHRASASLIFNWIYRCMRNINEDEANHAANELVAEAKTALVRKVVI